MKALVTGGGGFLGLYIVEQLLAAGNEVRVLCRGDYPALQALGVEVQRGDVRNADEVERAVSGVESVFHTAAVPGIWGPWERYHSINTIGTENIVKACGRQGVRRLIYTSSPSVVFDGADHVDADESLPYPSDWLCHYPHSKALGEQAVLAANSTDGLRTVSLRPHLIWGRRDNHLIPRLIDRARSGRLRRVGRGDNVVSMVNVENAAAAHVQADIELANEGRCAGKAYFVNEPQAVRLWDWIDELLALANLPPVKKSISLGNASRIGWCCETIWSLLRLSGEPPMTRFVAAQLAGSHSYSIQAAQRDFGFTPIVTVEEGMRRLRKDLA